MSFWSMVVAVLVALAIWDILWACIKAAIKWRRYKMERRNERAIGFDVTENGKKDEKSNNAPVKMRKIGFGANAEEE